MVEPIETMIIHAQQSFEIAGGLNPVQIEIDDDRILNMLKKYKNVRYRLTPQGFYKKLHWTNIYNLQRVKWRQENF